MAKKPSDTQTNLDEVRQKKLAALRDQAEMLEARVRVVELKARLQAAQAQLNGEA